MSEEQQPPKDVQGTANVTGDNSGVNVGVNTGTINQQQGQTVAGDQYNAGRDIYQHTHHHHGTPTAAPLAIPVPVADFTGREAELADLTAALATGGTASITGLRGMGGIGKSQLAFRLAHDLKPHYPKQVMVALLGSTAAPLAPTAALQRIIQHFVPAAQLPDDLPSLTAIYQGCLADHGQPVLVLADDAADAAQTRPLLPQGLPLVLEEFGVATDPYLRGEAFPEAPRDNAGQLIRPDDPQFCRHDANVLSEECRQTAP